MKQVLVFAAIIGLAVFGCKKSGSPVPAADSLAGTWKMIAVTDNASGAATTKPSSIQKDVTLTFTVANPNAGTFTGLTPTNDIWTNNYTIGANHAISIPSLAMTKVSETSWGLLLVDNICFSQTYSLQAGRLLNIRTLNKTLLFQKQ